MNVPLSSYQTNPVFQSTTTITPDPNTIPESANNEYSAGVYYGTTPQQYMYVDTTYAMFTVGTTLNYIYQVTAASLYDQLTGASLSPSGAQLGHGNVTTFDNNGLAFAVVRDNGTYDLTPILSAKWYTYNTTSTKMYIGIGLFTTGTLTPADINGRGYYQPHRDAWVYANGAQTLGTYQLGDGNTVLSMMLENRATVFPFSRFDRGWNWHQDINGGLWIYSPTSQQVFQVDTRT